MMRRISKSANISVISMKQKASKRIATKRKRYDYQASTMIPRAKWSIPALV